MNIDRFCFGTDRCHRRGLSQTEGHYRLLECANVIQTLFSGQLDRATEEIDGGPEALDIGTAKPLPCPGGARAVLNVQVFHAKPVAASAPSMAVRA